MSDDINNNLTEIKKDLTEIKKDLTEIKETLKINNENAEEHNKKLSEHIDFVESIYSRIKRPFHYVFDKVKVLGSLEN